MRRAVAYSVVVVPAAEIDAYGLHVANLAGHAARAGQLARGPSYVAHRRLPRRRAWACPAPRCGRATRRSRCIAAASILAKVTRDRIMTDCTSSWPDYDFAEHKGYITPSHSAALTAIRTVPATPAPLRQRAQAPDAVEAALIEVQVGATMCWTTTSRARGELREC